MSTQKITDPADVRPGDSVTVKWLDSDGEHYSTITGTARRAANCLYVGPAALRVDGKGSLLPSVVEWSATRETPDLPTEPGSVIVDVTVRGGHAQLAVLDHDGDWITATEVDGYLWHPAERITAWTPAKIVTDGEPVTR